MSSKVAIAPVGSKEDREQTRKSSYVKFDHSKTVPLNFGEHSASISCILLIIRERPAIGLIL
jgi:hypothetical protein